MVFSLAPATDRLTTELAEALRAIGEPAQAAQYPALLGSIMAANPTVLAQSDLFLRKQNNKREGIYDPVCGTSVRVASGSDFLNNFHCENFPPEVVKIWFGLADGTLTGKNINPFHFGIMPVLSPAVPFQDEKLSVRSRYCGENLSQTIHSLKLANQFVRAWAERGADHHIPSQLTMLQHVVFDTVRQEEGFSPEFTASIAALADRIGHTDSEDPNSAAENLAAFDAEIAALSESLRKLGTPRDQDFAFLSILLLKAMYIDASLAAAGVVHGHLHPGNVTWELFDKQGDLGELNCGELRAGNFSFSKAAYLANPERYHLVTRMIDLGTLHRRPE